MAQPPAFGSQEYWDARFTSDTTPFEWLHPPDSLDPHLAKALDIATDQNPQILHIGCGTSLLSHHLRRHVRDPETIHNLDYSQVAVDIGRKRELDFSAAEQECKQEATESADVKYMRWSAANLFDHASLLGVCKPGTYTVIVDKSTSDSIACADDVRVPLPYPVGVVPERPPSQHRLESELVDPLQVLAVNAALLAKPKARWLCLSYSTDRWPFLRDPSCTASRDFVDEHDAVDDGVMQGSDNGIANGLPDPAKLWRIVSRDELEVIEKEGETAGKFTHRPKIVDWIYVLERTDVPLYVYGS